MPRHLRSVSRTPRADRSELNSFRQKPQEELSTEHFQAISATVELTLLLLSPMNRWTSYESKSETDWLEIDFGREVEFRRMELAIYDDRGGVPPDSNSTQRSGGPTERIGFDAESLQDGDEEF